MTSEQRPACSKCQTPMVRYNVPHTGDKEQAWRLACSCKHSAVNEVVHSNEQLSPEAAECNRIAKDFHALMMKEKPGSKAAVKYAHLSEGALACLIYIKQLQNSPDETTADIRQLFNKGIGVQLRNKFSFSFETEDEANRAFHYIADLGTLETSQGLNAVEPSPAHTTEQDFQHWLSYSGMRYSFKHVATEPELRIAYYAGADVAPPKSAGCPTHGMEHFFEGMCIKCGTVPAVNGT